MDYGIFKVNKGGGYRINVQNREFSYLILFIIKCFKYLYGKKYYAGLS